MKEKLESIRELYTLLKSKEIFVETIPHPKVTSCDDSRRYYEELGYNLTEYSLCKNLFIRDKRGKKFWLVIVDYQKRVDMILLRAMLGTSKLGPATIANLLDILDVEKGSVSIFSLINDKQRKVNVILDEELKYKNKLAFHPNYNGLTCFIKSNDVVKFLSEMKINYQFVNIPFHEYNNLNDNNNKVLAKCRDK
jgi:Ala-tRNA(Pro) deacylase